jgi:hypothetical protein
MDDLQKFIQRNFRRILAGAGIVLSLLAISLLLNTSPSTMVWMATGSIPAGSRITANGVKLVRADLTQDSLHYESKSDLVVGQFATRLLQPGDLIAVTDVARQGANSTSTFLPIGVAVDDLPADLEVGDLVDIYVIPKDQGVLPAVVAHRVPIQNIDIKSRALGGSVAVCVSANPTVTSIIVTAEAQGRLVLARDPF